MGSSREVDFGDRVRVLPTKETQAVGFAGQTGLVYGFTKPSVMGVRAVGGEGIDHAICVQLETGGASVWFALICSNSSITLPGRISRSAELALFETLAEGGSSSRGRHLHYLPTASPVCPAAAFDNSGALASAVSVGWCVCQSVAFW